MRDRVVRVIRELRPTTVVSCDPTAWFFEGGRYYDLLQPLRPPDGGRDRARRLPGAGNPHFFSEHLSQGLDPHSVGEVWLGWTNEPNRREDITGYPQAKVNALSAHASQLAEGIAFFEEQLEREARDEGATIGVEHAEAFRRLELS